MPRLARALAGGSPAEDMVRTAIHLVHVAQHLLRQQQVSTAVDESEHAQHQRTFDGVLHAGAARVARRARRGALRPCGPRRASRGRGLRSAVVLVGCRPAAADR